MILRGLFVALITGFAFQCSAQQFGGFPPSTQWKQINTDTARVIFEPKAVGQAQRIASLLHRIAATENTLGGRQSKINIVLHRNTTLANGYVGLGPFRSELYLVPGSNIFDFGNLPWNEQLIVHEYRHVQQYNNFNHGISNVVGFLFGQEGRALANAIAVPDWFFEGDAVYAETVETPQGRGRMPYFFNGFNSIWKEGRHYSWMKLRNGSLKDQVPNHYPLGFLLVNYGYLKYGKDFWKKVTQDATAFKGIVYPFQQAVKRNAGIPFKTFRTDALAYYNHEVSKRRDDQRAKESVADYYFPQVIGEDSLLYLKSSYRSLPAFYIQDKQGAHRIQLRSISTEDWLNYRNGSIVYTAYSTHPRWSLTDYSDIVLLDVHSKKETRLTHHEKYFTPAFSPDGNTIVAVHVNDSLQSELHFLDREGKLLNSRSAPPNALFIHPQFINAQSLVVGIRHGNAKISIHRLDLTTMKFEQLLPATFATVGFFYPYRGTVYFTSSLNGSDDLYSYSLSTKKALQLTGGGVGHYYANVHDSVLTWSEATGSGYRIRQKPLDGLLNLDIPVGQWGLAQAPFTVAYGDSAQPILATPTRDFVVKKYRKGTGLLNFHSWRPNYEDPELTVSVYGNNVLNTLSSELFYRYNQNETSHAVGFNTAYGGLFPVLSTGVEHTFERTIKTRTRNLTVQQSEARVGYSIPFNFTQGKTYKYLDFGSNFVFNQTKPTGSTNDILNSFHTTYLHHFVSWTHRLPKARQQIYSHLGYSVNGALRHRTDEKGYQQNGNAAFYLPSPFATHSLVLSGSFQQTDTSNVLFSNHFPHSRGYADFFYSRMWRASANYHLPLWYPDWGFANLVYFLRIRGNAFYDYTKVYSKTKTATRNLRSTGGEIYFDTRWWNSLPVTFGVRYSYLLDANVVGAKSPHVFELIVPVGLIPR